MFIMDAPYAHMQKTLTVLAQPGATALPQADHILKISVISSNRPAEI